ncbi:MAG: undecaprenyl-diphosphate phosphatase [Clostridia bacterium]|nr:undecaprenyl-diphosphate phosphatase [Clostridia bacterium]
MTVIEGILLGILQGATEFLPISSSGHLMLVQKLFGQTPSLLFSVILHVGTLFAVITVMYKPVSKMLFRPFKDMRMGMVILASIPTFIIALIVELTISVEFMQYFLPAGFLITASLLAFNPKKQPITPLYQKKALPVLVAGIAQGFAVLPGISRSGATLTALNFFGIKKEQSAEFVFLLSLPVILGGAVVETYKATKTPSLVQNSDILPMILGMIFAYVVGVLCLKFFVNYLKTKSLKPFALYMIIPFLVSLLVL